MKTSNIILIATAASVTFLLSAGIIQNRFAPEAAEGITGKYESVFEDIDLPDYKFLVIRNQENFTISSSEKSRLSVSYKKGDDKPEVDLNTLSDTLYIGNEIKNSAKSYSLTLYIPGQAEGGIRITNSNVQINKLAVERLFLRLENSQVNFSGTPDNEIRLLDLHGTDHSRFFSQSLALGSLDLHLDHSEATFLKSIGVVKGSISNGSKLQVRNISRFEFNKDESSTLIYIP